MGPQQCSWRALNPHAESTAAHGCCEHGRNEVPVTSTWIPGLLLPPPFLPRSLPPSSLSCRPFTFSLSPASSFCLPACLPVRPPALPPGGHMGGPEGVWLQGPEPASAAAGRPCCLAAPSFHFRQHSGHVSSSTSSSRSRSRRRRRGERGRRGWRGGGRSSGRWEGHRGRGPGRCCSSGGSCSGETFGYARLEILNP